MTRWHILKTILYVSAGILIFILHDAFMPYVGYLVGGVVIVYALEEFIIATATKTLVYGRGHLIDVITQTAIGVLLILSAEDVIKVCLIWGVWSILRESKELTRALAAVFRKRPGHINAVESVVMIVLSAIMVIEPSAHHAHIHVILLGVELILEVVFEWLNTLYDFSEKKKAARETLRHQADLSAETSPEAAAADDE